MRKLTTRRVLVAGAVVLIATGAMVVPWMRSPEVRYDMTMWYVECRLERGDMGWVQDIEYSLQSLEESTLDKTWLADKLLEESDGSLACEGMILAYRIHHPHIRRILEAHLADTRWNWSMTLNDRVARQLLAHLDGHDELVEDFVYAWIANWPREGPTESN